MLYRFNSYELIPGPGTYETDYNSIEKRLKTSHSAERAKKNRVKLKTSHGRSRNGKDQVGLRKFNGILIKEFI